MQSRKEPSLELFDATLQTPDATYPLKFAGDTRHPFATNPGMKVRGRAPDLRVVMAFFSTSPQVGITPDPRTLEVLIDAEGCFYQRDDGDRLALATNAPERGVYRGEPASAILELALPPPLSGIVLGSHTLPGETIRAIEAISGER
jgi:hypothetical protein